jgi:hypothetical protein
MGLGLPDISGVEFVVFHVEPGTSTDLVLQVPPRKQGAQSNTYRVDLTEAPDRAWLQRLRLERDLRDKLSLYGHALYFPATGESRGLEDRDAVEMTAAQMAYEAAGKRASGRGGRWDDVPVGVRRKKRPTMR